MVLLVVFFSAAVSSAGFSAVLAGAFFVVLFVVFVGFAAVFVVLAVSFFSASFSVSAGFFSTVSAALAVSFFSVSFSASADFFSAVFLVLLAAGFFAVVSFFTVSVSAVSFLFASLFTATSMYPTVFTLFGWFMLLTSLVLYFVPKRLHHDFSNKSADILKPIYFQFISPISVAIGIMLIKAVI